MAYNSLKSLLKEYPHFFDKRESSNFTKTRRIWNNRMIELYDDLFQVYLDSKVRKHALIWKTQEEKYNYTIHFAVSIPKLKKITCYKNNTEIYTQEYTQEEEQYLFQYDYNDSTPEVYNDDGSGFNPYYDPFNDDPEHIASIPEERLIIPEDQYHIKIETYDEYTIEKGFPENDEAQGDIFDHDESLDHFGDLLEIPRKTYTYGEDTDYSLTEPHYNNRLTEDDYNYMNRILYYAEHVHDTPLPLLELWKLFGDDIDASMTNREDLLCKMFSKAKHTPEGGVYDDSWVPEKWEHKDAMGCPREEPVYFFANVNDASPIYGRKIKFTFKFFTSLVETNYDYKYIKVYLNGEEYFYTPDTGGDPTSLITDYYWIISTKSFGEEVYDLKFQFKAYKTLTDFNEDVEYIESEEIPVTIKGCGNADYYVNYNTGDDSNDGSRENPLKTLEYAVSLVETSNNVIVLQAGTHIINDIIDITTDTGILSCGDSIIKSTSSCDIFRIYHDHELDLVNVGLNYKCCNLFAEDEKFINNNTKNEKEIVTIPLTECKIPVSLKVNNKKPVIYAHTNYTLTGNVTSLELTGRKTYVESDETGTSFDLGTNAIIKHLNIMGEKLENEPINLYDGIIIDPEKLKQSTESDNQGEYSFDLRFNKKGTFTYGINHPETVNYCNSDVVDVSFTVEDMPTTLQAEISTDEILIGDLLPINYTLKDYYDIDVETGSLYLYEDDVLVETVEAYDDFTYIPPLGNHTYKVVFKGDSYVESTVTGLTCNVRKYHTSMVLLTDKTNYSTSETIVAYGTLIDEISRPVKNALIKLYDGDVLLSQSYSREDDGTVTFNINNLTEGRHYLRLTYNGSDIYDECNSNIFNVRIRNDELSDINLYLYPEVKILEADTQNIPCHVYACDKNGDPLKNTGFHIWSTYSGEHTDNYTTGNDGWCDFTINTNAIHNCHGIVLQAISTVDEDVYSNIVFIRDFVDNPLPITDYEVISEKPRYSYKYEEIPVSGYLIDIEDSVVPNEEVTLGLYDGDTLLNEKTATTNIKGEFSTVLKNNGVRLNTLTVKLTYNGNTKYAGVTEDCSIVFYPPATRIETYDSLSLYRDVNTFNVPLSLIDEFENDVIDGDVVLKFNNQEYNATVSDGQCTFNSLTVPEAGTYTIKLNYNGNSYYKNSQYSFTLTVLKLDTSLNNISVPSITFTDPFTITGFLNNLTRETIIKSKPVNLYVDGTLVKTANTNNKGKFSITHTISDSAGPHTLQLKYDGDNVFNACESSTINVDVNRETSVLTLLNPKTSYFLGNNFDLNGTLLTDDGEKINESVKLYVNNKLKQTVTPDSNGDFTFTYLNELGEGEYSIRVVHDQSNNYTSAEYSYNCKVINDTLKLYIYIDSEDETGEVNYGEEFIITVIDSEFQETTRYSNIFSNLIFNIYDSEDNVVNVDYEDNVFLDSRVYTVHYLSSMLLTPGDYKVKVISPITDITDYKEVTLPVTVKDSLKLYAYGTGEGYSEDIYEDDEFIVTVLDDTFNEGKDIYSEVYENLELTVYDSNNNIVELPYETNIYNDCSIYTMLYDATTGLNAGNYKILIVSPATTIHGRKQVTLNITIKEKPEENEEQ